jgi:hypothetical protein
MENKIVLLGKEYELQFTRGVKDITSGTLVGVLRVKENEDNLNANFEVSIRPAGEKILELEPKFIQAVEDGFKQEMDKLKQKEAIAKAQVQTGSSGATVVEAEIV